MDWKLYSEQVGWNLQARGPNRGLKNLYTALTAFTPFSTAAAVTGASFSIS